MQGKGQGNSSQRMRGSRNCWPRRCWRRALANGFCRSTGRLLGFPRAQRKKPRHRSGVEASQFKPDNDLLSHGETPHYHRRRTVSLLSSVWDQVVPVRYCRQATGNPPLTGCLGVCYASPGCPPDGLIGVLLAQTAFTAFDNKYNPENEALTTRKMRLVRMHIIQQ